MTTFHADQTGDLAFSVCLDETCKASYTHMWRLIHVLGILLRLMYARECNADEEKKTTKKSVLSNIEFIKKNNNKIVRSSTLREI